MNIAVTKPQMVIGGHVEPSKAISVLYRIRLLVTASTGIENIVDIMNTTNVFLNLYIDSPASSSLKCLSHNHVKVLDNLVAYLITLHSYNLLAPSISLNAYGSLVLINPLSSLVSWNSSRDPGNISDQ